MFNREILQYKDQLLIVKRKLREAHLKTDPDIEFLKQWANADIVLRKDGILYLCETIQDAEILE